jgi:glycogen debranching enzyme
MGRNTEDNIQGPEWGWPLGYFLKAYLEFDNVNKDDTLHYLHRLLLEARGQIENDCWRGLPELTNGNGGYCGDSCRTQAWSASTLLDFLASVHRLD